MFGCVLVAFVIAEALQAREKRMVVETYPEDPEENRVESYSMNGREVLLAKKRMLEDKIMECEAELARIRTKLHVAELEDES